MKKISVFILAAVLLTGLTVCPAIAADGYGEPAPAENSGSGIISVGGDTDYDRTRGAFVFRVGVLDVESNVPSGIVTTDPVSVSVPTGMAWRLFRDGKEVTDADIGNVKEVGKYILLFGDPAGTTFRFTIVGSLTGELNEYMLPDGFAVESVMFDGQKAEQASSYIVDMSAEGRYDIRYGCKKADIIYRLTVTTDHTPPVLKLEAVNDGVASGPVDISDLEPDVEAEILLNGSEIGYSDELTKSGDYRITLRDPAGNVTVYRFTIRVYFNFNSFAFVFILAAGAAALVIYLVRSRKKLRIR